MKRIKRICNIFIRNFRKVYSRNVKTMLNAKYVFW